LKEAVTTGRQLTPEEIAIRDTIQTIWREADRWALQQPQAVATLQHISQHALASQEADSPFTICLVPRNKASGAVPQPLSPCSVASTPSGSTLLEDPRVTETKEPETGAIALDNLWCQLGLQVTPDNLASEFHRCFNKHMDLVDEMALEPHTHNGRCKELAQRVKDTKLELAVIESYQNLIRYNQATNHTPQGYLVCPEAFHQFGGISYAYTPCPSKQVRHSWERLQHFYQGAMHKALSELARQQGQILLSDPIAHALHFLAKAGV
ncbi:hypothetical protein IWQ60_010363, partial [Tieghemiomyces parasiticus]